MVISSSYSISMHYAMKWLLLNKIIGAMLIIQGTSQEKHRPCISVVLTFFGHLRFTSLSGPCTEHKGVPLAALECIQPYISACTPVKVLQV